MPTPEDKANITIFLPKPMLQRLQQQAKSEDRSRSSVARRAIESYLDSREQQGERERAGAKS